MVNKILLCILGGICIFLAFNNFLKGETINALTEQNKNLQADLKAQITITAKRQIIYKTRTKEGEVKTVIKYLPAEGSATINQNVESGEISLSVKNKGLTARLSLIGLIDKEPAAGIGLRALYWGRYGIGGGAAFKESSIFPLVYFDRYIDDFIPFAHNTSLGITAIYPNLSRVDIRAGVFVYF